MSNILSEVHPELVAEWSERNLPLTPDKITYLSGRKSIWLSALVNRKAENGWNVKGGEAVHLTLDISEVFCYFVLWYNLYCSEGYRFTTKQYPSYVLQGIHPNSKGD